MIGVVAFIKRREWQRLERRQSRREFSQHRGPADVVITVVIQDGRTGKLNPTHYSENRHEGRSDLSSPRQRREL